MVFVEALSNGLGYLQHIGQVGRAVLVGWRADSREDDLLVVDDRSEVGRKLQSASLDILLNQLHETGLVDRNIVVLETLDLVSIGVDTSDDGACVRKARAADESDVSGTYNCYIHFYTFKLSLCLKVNYSKKSASLKSLPSKSLGLVTTSFWSIGQLMPICGSFQRMLASWAGA